MNGSETLSDPCAGIGSRPPPEIECQRKRVIAASLARGGWFLPSGPARGADSACEAGAGGLGPGRSISPAAYGGGMSARCAPPPPKRWNWPLDLILPGRPAIARIMLGIPGLNLQQFPVMPAVQ